MKTIIGDGTDERKNQTRSRKTNPGSNKTSSRTKILVQDTRTKSQRERKTSGNIRNSNTRSKGPGKQIQHKQRI